MDSGLISLYFNYDHVPHKSLGTRIMILNRMVMISALDRKWNKALKDATI